MRGDAGGSSNVKRTQNKKIVERKTKQEDPGKSDFCLWVFLRNLLCPRK